MFRTLFLSWIVVITAASTAEAGYPHIYGPNLGRGGFGANIWPGLGFGFGNGIGYVPPPPYYAIHPPVYYSPTIIRRPYGMSPFAMPPVAQPLSVNQPAATVEPPPEPLLIINPYFGSGGVVRKAEAVVPPGSESLPAPMPPVVPKGVVPPPVPPVPMIPLPKQ